MRYLVDFAMAFVLGFCTDSFSAGQNLQKNPKGKFEEILTRKPAGKPSEKTFSAQMPKYMRKPAKELTEKPARKSRRKPSRMPTGKRKENPTENPVKIPVGNPTENIRKVC